MLFFSLTLSCITLTSFAMAFSGFANVKFTNSLPPVLAILLSLLTMAAMCGVLYGATYCIYIAGVGFGICSAFQNAKAVKTALREFSGEIIFLLLLVFLYSFFMRDSALTVWDDFSHWGVFSKELFIYNGIEHQGTVTSIINSHAHYPRGPSIYHYFMLFGSGYSEPGLLIAHFILHLIFLAPLFGNRNGLITVFFILTVLASLALYTTAFRSIYNDSTTALIFSSIFLVYLLVSDRRKAILLAMIISSFFPLFREVGLVLSLLAAIFIIYNEYFIRDVSIKGVDYFLYSLLFILPFLSYFGWLAYFKATHDFFGRSEHSISNLIHLVQTFDESRWQLIIGYGKALALFFLKEGSIFTYFVLGISWYLVKKYSRQSTLTLKRQLAALFVCFLFYCLWRLYLYFFTYSYVEALRGASLLRYLGLFCVSFIVMLYVPLKKSTSEVSITKIEKVTLVVVSMLSLCIIMQTGVLRIRHSTPSGREYSRQVQIIEKFIIDGYKVEVDFSNKTNGMECYEFNYKLSPHSGKQYLSNCLKAQTNLIKEPAGSDYSRVDPAVSQMTKAKMNDCKIMFYPFLLRMEAICIE